MSFVTLKMSGALIGGTIQTQNSGTVVVAADGTVTVNSLDAPDLLRAGATFVNVRTGFVYYPAPLAATVGQLVASTALSNGTLSIAHQPDVPRQAAMIVVPGTTAITAGTLTLNYVAADGTTQVDALSLVTAVSTNLTTNASKGVMFINSAVVAGLAGGTSPAIELNTTALVAMPVDANAVDVVVVSEVDSGTPHTPSTTIVNQSCFATSSAPNGTINYSLGFTFTAPNS